MLCIHCSSCTCDVLKSCLHTTNWDAINCSPLLFDVLGWGSNNEFQLPCMTRVCLFACSKVYGVDETLLAAGIAVPALPHGKMVWLPHNADYRYYLPHSSHRLYLRWTAGQNAEKGKSIKWKVLPTACKNAYSDILLAFLTDCETKAFDFHPQPVLLEVYRHLKSLGLPHLEYRHTFRNVWGSREERRTLTMKSTCWQEAHFFHQPVSLLGSPT